MSYTDTAITSLPSGQIDFHTLLISLNPSEITHYDQFATLTDIEDIIETEGDDLTHNHTYVDATVRGH